MSLYVNSLIELTRVVGEFLVDDQFPNLIFLRPIFITFIIFLIALLGFTIFQKKVH